MHTHPQKHPQQQQHSHLGILSIWKKIGRFAYLKISISVKIKSK